MTFEQLRELKDGDMIVFKGEHRLLTKGRTYRVIETEWVGHLVMNDNGFGTYLINVYESFDLVENKK